MIKNFGAVILLVIERKSWNNDRLAKSYPHGYPPRKNVFLNICFPLPISH